jgi:hypothetical protein
MLRRMVGLLSCLCLTSCLTAEFSTLRVSLPPSEESRQEIEAGMDLQACLDLLGAPTSVRRADDGWRTVMSWEWMLEDGFGISFSVPIADQASASADYGSNSQDFQQFRVFFDAEFKVVEISKDGIR